MGKRLYVGNLPYDATEAALRAAFSQDGRTVERVNIVLDRETQRPRGFAFIEMATDEQAKAAITAMDSQLFGTRQLRVTEAEDRRAGGPGGPSPGGGGSPRGPSGSGGPPRSSSPHGGPSSGPGGARSDDARNRFGPDARPKRERERDLSRRPAPPRPRPEIGGDDAYGGRRGGSRFDDDDE